MHVARNMEYIPGDPGCKVGDILDSVPSQRRTQPITHNGQFSDANACYWTSGRKLPRGNFIKTPGENINSANTGQKPESNHEPLR